MAIRSLPHPPNIHTFMLERFNLRPNLLHLQRIPNPLEAKSPEILFIRRGEFRHALPEQRKRSPPIMGAAAGEILSGKSRPKFIVKDLAVGRESDDLPAAISSRKPPAASPSTKASTTRSSACSSASASA